MLFIPSLILLLLTGQAVYSQHFTTGIENSERYDFQCALWFLPYFIIFFQIPTGFFSIFFSRN
ncbi:unnamed protein product [Haemonchus placei]|uniref:Uncharacterized protein n=1 Tax=Haemonchus placei TaxID=6290 RepID=A0A0N4WYV9_HAEPC|nr:unnamed protein product [Haemonchus placei]